MIVSAADGIQFSEKPMVLANLKACSLDRPERNHADHKLTGLLTSSDVVLV